MNTPLVLCYHMGPERTARLKTLCLIQKLRFRVVAPEEYGESIGALAGLLPKSNAPAPASSSVQEEMLVLCHFSESALNGFLLGFRKSGMTPVALKAVLTPTNADWNSLQLYEELRREHAVMSAGR